MIRSIKGDLTDIPVILVGNKCDEVENREVVQVGWITLFSSNESNFITKSEQNVWILIECLDDLLFSSQIHFHLFPISVSSFQPGKRIMCIFSTFDYHVPSVGVKGFYLAHRPHRPRLGKYFCCCSCSQDFMHSHILSKDWGKFYLHTSPEYNS